MCVCVRVRVLTCSVAVGRGICPVILSTLAIVEDTSSLCQLSKHLEDNWHSDVFISTKTMPVVL